MAADGFGAYVANLPAAQRRANLELRRLIERPVTLEPTGVNDDAQINAAIHRVSTAGGGTVRLLAGTYDIRNSVTLKDNIRLEGVGDATILKLHALAGVRVVTNEDAGGAGNSNMQLANLQIDGNGNLQPIVPNNTGTGVDAVYFIRATNLLVENCYIHDGNRHNLFVSDASSAVRIIGNRLKSALGLTNISAYNGSDFTISGNVSSNANETGTKMDSMHTVAITGNTYFNNTTIQVYVTGGSNITITGNSIRGGQNGVRIVSEDYTVVADNVIRDPSQHGIVLLQNCDHTTITGNVIRNVGSASANTYDGINVSDTGTGCTYTLISGNDITDVNSKMRYGICSLNSSDRVKHGPNWISGYVTGTVSLVGANNANILERQGSSIYLDGPPGPSINTNGDYIHLDADTDIYLDGNTIYLRNAAGTDYGYVGSAGIGVYGTRYLGFPTYGGGWYMSDTTWIRAYGNKNIYTPGEIRGGIFTTEGDGYMVTDSADTDSGLYHWGDGIVGLVCQGTGVIQCYSPGCTTLGMYPGYQFRLNGISDANHGIEYSAGTPSGSGEASNGPLYRGYTSHWWYENGTGQQMYLSSGGNLFLNAGKSFTNFSSREFKKNITALDPNECLDHVLRWRPVEFDIDHDAPALLPPPGSPPVEIPPAEIHAEGFIAEEIYEVTPNVCVMSTDPERPDWAHGLDYGNMTSRLAGAVQALSAKIAQLEAEIAELRGG